MTSEFFLEQSKRSYVFDLVWYFIPHVDELILKIEFYGIYSGVDFYIIESLVIGLRLILLGDLLLMTNNIMFQFRNVYIRSTLLGTGFILMND